MAYMGRGTTQNLWLFVWCPFSTTQRGYPQNVHIYIYIIYIYIYMYAYIHTHQFRAIAREARDRDGPLIASPRKQVRLPPIALREYIFIDRLHIVAVFSNYECVARGKWAPCIAPQAFRLESAEQRDAICVCPPAT